MRGTDLFTNEPEITNSEELMAFGEHDTAGAEDFAHDLAKPVAGLRILELEDCDVAPDAIDAMESGHIRPLKTASAEDAEARLVVEEEGYSVRVALVDVTAGAATKAIDRAILTEVDLIVIGPLDRQAMTGDLGERLQEAARTGHGVFTLG